MKYLKFVFQFSIAVIFTLSSFTTESEPILIGLNQNSSVILNVPEEDFTFVRVLIDGVWWIYVYDSDGKLVNRYIEDQD